MGHAEQTKAQPIGLIALVDAQQPRFDQSGQHAMRGRLGQTRLLGDFDEAQRLVAFGDDVEQRQPPAQRLRAGNFPRGFAVTILHHAERTTGHFSPFATCVRRRSSI